VIRPLILTAVSLALALGAAMSAQGPAGSYVVTATMPGGTTREAIETLTTAQMDARFAAAERLLRGPGGMAASMLTSPAAGPAMPPAPSYGYVPVFYPGTAVASDAQPIGVAFGDERTGIDITLSLTPAVRLEGTVIGPGGPLPQMQVALTPDPSVPFAGKAQPGWLANVMPDGSFHFTAVAPGRYALTARTQPGQPVLWAGSEVVVTGLFRPAASLPGTATWWLRSAVLAGRDLLDDPVVVPPDQDEPIGGLVLTFSDRRRQLAGTLQAPTGAPAAEYLIVVFTTERRWWRPDARRLAFTRPATDGQFVVRDLPPGEYYLAAVTDLDTTSWQTAAFLEQIVTSALKVTLGEGESKTQDVRIAR